MTEECTSHMLSCISNEVLILFTEPGSILSHAKLICGTRDLTAKITNSLNCTRKCYSIMQPQCKTSEMQFVIRASLPPPCEIISISAIENESFSDNRTLSYFLLHCPVAAASFISQIDAVHYNLQPQSKMSCCP